MTTTIGQASAVRGRFSNNFDVLRLVAAACVLISHSWPLTGGGEPGVPLTHDTLGYVAVLVFFSISGFLITQSWMVDPRPIAFAWKRALRVIPALVVMLVLVAYVVGTAVTVMDRRSYLTSDETLKYVVTNTLMSTNYALPGVFSDNPSTTVNGSLGTLPVEIKAYAVVLVLGLLIAARRWVLRIALSVALAVVLLGSFLTGVKSPSTILVLFTTFAGAAALYFLRDRTPLDPRLFAACVAVWVGSYYLPLPLHALLTGLTFPYVVLFLAFRWLKPLRLLTKPGDVSYGIFIWAFPVQQTIVHLGPDMNAWALLAVALPVTYAIALLSWHLVESPALRQKGRFARPSAPVSPSNQSERERSRPVDVQSAATRGRTF